MRPTVAQIDLSAIRHNIQQLRTKLTGNTHLIAVVKADAYGHGAVQVSKTALSAGAASLAVAIPEEGAQLREAGLTVPIFILGLTLPEQADLIVRYNLIASVCTVAGARALDQKAGRLQKAVEVMLKVDTGMSRIGVAPDGLLPLVQELRQLPAIQLKGIFTHLATADALDKSYAHYQLKLFNSALEKLAAAGISPLIVSAGNSATTIDLPPGLYNAVRPGIAIYGLPPSAEMHNRLDLWPAMQFKTKIVYIKKVPGGTPVSYGCTYTTPCDTFLATLPVGYADGYSRCLSNRARVLIGGIRRPLAGRVCMDQVVVDLGPQNDASIGDEAILFGRQGNEEITATELADIAGTINYETVCAVSSRVPRIYTGE